MQGSVRTGATGQTVMDLKLEDWQADKSTEEPRSIDLALSISGDRIEVETPDGRSVCLELQDGNLRVLGYNKLSDGPVITEIPEAAEISTSAKPYVDDLSRQVDDDMAP